MLALTSLVSTTLAAMSVACGKPALRAVEPCGEDTFFLGSCVPRAMARAACGPLARVDDGDANETCASEMTCAPGEARDVASPFPGCVPRSVVASLVLAQGLTLGPDDSLACDDGVLVRATIDGDPRVGCAVSPSARGGGDVECGLGAIADRGRCARIVSGARGGERIVDVGAWVRAAIGPTPSGRPPLCRALDPFVIEARTLVLDVAFDFPANDPSAVTSALRVVSGFGNESDLGNRELSRSERALIGTVDRVLVPRVEALRRLASSSSYPASGARLVTSAAHVETRVHCDFPRKPPRIVVEARGETGEAEVREAGQRAQNVRGN